MKSFSVFITILATASAFAPTPIKNVQRNAVALQMANADAEFYIDQERRNVMNLILVGSAGVTIAGLAIPFIAFFVPPGSGGGAGGSAAKDALGNGIMLKDYLESKPAGDRSLAQGLKGDAT